MTYLIALTLNLAGMLVIYSLMAYALVRLSWHRRGIISVLALIMIAGLFWSAPTLLAGTLAGKSAGPVSYSLWFGDWLVSGFSVIILTQSARWIPRQLEDSARLDGCGRFGTYYHIVLPLVRRDLWLIGFLTLMGTSVLLLTPVSVLDGGFATTCLARLLSTGPEGALGLVSSIGLMAVASLLATLPVVVVFLFAKRSLPARQR